MAVCIRIPPEVVSVHIQIKERAKRKCGYKWVAENIARGLRRGSELVVSLKNDEWRRFDIVNIFSVHAEAREAFLTNLFQQPFR